METIIKKIEIPPDRRIIAVSDIHGHYHHLKGLLKKVSFTEMDILFIVGDILEKGPLCLQTLRYVMDLCKNYTVYPLMGNVDAAVLLMLEESDEDLYEFISAMKSRWGSSLLTDMCSEIDLHISGPADMPQMKEEIRKHFKEEFDFLQNLATIIETQHYIFVHGGLPSDDIDSFEGTDAIAYLKNDAFMEKGIIFNKYTVVGHWPVTLYNEKIASLNPIINNNQKIISIDGGCGLKRDGQLNALIIPHINSSDISFAYYDDLPLAFAQTPQEKSFDSVNIRYTDHKITILEKGPEFSFAEHPSSGHRLWIHNDYIYSFDENATCDDYTDYKLPVKPGDVLSILMKTSKGYLAKKDGISGWYEGTLTYRADDKN